MFNDGTIQLGGLRIASDSLGILAVSLAAMLALYFFFGFTRQGVAMRAASLNRRAARLMGIDVEYAGLLACFCGRSRRRVRDARRSGALSRLRDDVVDPAEGLRRPRHRGFDSAVGVVFGCIMLGIGETFLGAYVSGAFKDAFALTAIVLFLMFKPNGLFGSAQVKKV